MWYILLIGLCVAHATAQRLGHIVVADAGSSHTSFFIYNWTVSDPGETARSIQQCCGLKMAQVPFQCDIPYTINSVATADTTVSTCLGYVAGNLTRFGNIDFTPFYLRATAGLRLVNITNATKTSAILDAIRHSSRGHGFFNSGAPDSAAILTGEEEGAYGWATANFLHGTLHDAVRANRVSRALVESVATVGALDLGGASTQITFLSNNNASTVNLELYNDSLALYCHSYLCFGQNEASKRRTILLLKSTTPNLSGVTNVVDPCAPLGSSTTYTHTSFTKWVTDPCLEGYLTADDFVNATLIVNGSSNDKECQISVEKIFTEVINNNNSFDFSARSQQPSLPTTPIYAFSAYYYAVSGLFSNSSLDDVCNNSCSKTLNEIQSQTSQLCGFTLDQLQTFPKSFRKYAASYCMSGHYVQQLLIRYGVAMNATNIVFAGQLAGTDVGWTIGMALNLSQSLPSAPVVTPSSTSPTPRPGPHDDKKLPIGAVLAIAVVLPLITFAIVFGIRAMFRKQLIGRTLVDDDDALMAVNQLDTEPMIDRYAPTNQDHGFRHNIYEDA